MAKSGSIVRHDRRIPEKGLKTFLEDVVNASAEQSEATTAYFFTHYPRFFPALEQNIDNLLPFLARNLGINRDQKFLREESREIYYRAIVWELRDRLRSIWKSPDQYTADWRVFRLQAALHGRMGLRSGDDEDETPHEQGADIGDLPPSPDAPINQALTWLRKKFPNLKVCGNEECLTPFFIRADGKQRFCSAIVLKRRRGNTKPSGGLSTVRNGDRNEHRLQRRPHGHHANKARSYVDERDDSLTELVLSNSHGKCLSLEVDVSDANVSKFYASSSRSGRGERLAIG